MGVRRLAVLGLSDFPPKEKPGARSARHRREGKKQAAQGSTLSGWIGGLGERKKPRHRNESGRQRLSHRHAYNQGLATGNHGSTSVLSPHPIHSPPLWTKNHQGRLPSLHCPGQPAEAQGWGDSVASVRTPLTRSFSDVNPLQESSALPEVGWVAGRR